MSKVSQRNRGMLLERMIEQSNKQYRLMGAALINKIPTPTKISQKKGYAFYSEKSTVDFIGVCEGVHVAFDAKEVQGKAFPFRRVSQHQIDFLKDTQKQGGDAFLLILFKDYNELYKLTINQLVELTHTLDRKSIPYQWFKDNLKAIRGRNGVYYDYLNIAHNN